MVLFRRMCLTIGNGRINAIMEDRGSNSIEEVVVDDFFVHTNMLSRMVVNVNLFLKDFMFLNVKFILF